MQRNHFSLGLVALVVSFSIPAIAADNAPSRYYGIGGLPQEVRERIVVSEVRPLGILYTAEGKLDETRLEPQVTFTVRLNKGTYPRLADESKYHLALTYAAQMYALYSGHLSVTVGDLLESGFIPYADPQLDPDLSIDTEGSYLNVQTWDLYRAGSPEWLTFVKSNMVMHWRNPDGVTGSHPGSEMLKSEAERIAAFWVNPMTGESMKDSNEPGDYRWLGPAKGGGVWFSDNLGPGPGRIPFINAPSAAQYAIADGVSITLPDNIYIQTD